MEATEKNSLGYGKPPWIFKGSALYQLHLVKAETARAFIPKEFKLVEAFGYTLGGFFLANYEESPAGIFDELVVIAGIVWNPPTSCAWAAKVLVNSDKACIHGRKDVGLPSQVAHFRKNVSAIPRIQKKSRFGGFLSKIGLANHPSHATNRLDVQVKEMNDYNNLATLDICNINLTTSAMAAPRINSNWMGPKIKMSLPSFSGRTIHNPHLLKYCCQIECGLRFISPAKLSLCNVDGETVTTSNEEAHDVAEDNKENARNLCVSVLLSKPVLALEFNRLKMMVDAPTMVSCSADTPTTIPQ